MYPADLPDLFKGDQLVVVGRYSGAGDVEAKLIGNVGGREQTFTYKLHFDDRKTTDDYVPRLWATRRVGFLLDEIRIHGETAELRDETTELARKYGIVTPYTAYLIVEDEDRRRVPMADRSMQSMSADAATRAEVAKAWTGFKDKKKVRTALPTREARMRSSLRSRHRHRSHPVTPNHCGDLLPRLLLPPRQPRALASTRNSPGS